MKIKNFFKYLIIIALRLIRSRRAKPTFYRVLVRTKVMGQVVVEQIG